MMHEIDHKFTPNQIVYLVDRVKFSIARCKVAAVSITRYKRDAAIVNSISYFVVRDDDSYGADTLESDIFDNYTDAVSALYPTPG